MPNSGSKFMAYLKENASDYTWINQIPGDGRIESLTLNPANTMILINFIDAKRFSVFSLSSGNLLASRDFYHEN